MNAARPVTQEDLHAYLDDELDAERRGEVEARLREDAGAAALVRAFAEQRDLLRAAFDPVAEEVVPPRLLAVLAAPKRSMPWRAMAASVALLAAGAGAGWVGRGVLAPPETGVAAIAREALTSFATYGTDPARPVEIKAADRADLLRWLSRRLGQPVSAPDLAASGYRFLGGRLVATPHGPAGMFMYDDASGARLVMLVRPVKTEREAPVAELAEGALAGVSWAQDGLGYGLVGPATAKALHPLADEVRRQGRPAPAAVKG